VTRILTGLLIPADANRPLALLPVADSAASISDAIGAVLLDDGRHVPLPDGAFAAIYQPEDRTRLLDNPRLCLIVTRLGLVDRAFHAAARGDTLILGSTREHVDLDVPLQVVLAVRRAGCPLTIPDRPPTRALDQPIARPD
jgi:hypothetical protein